jgi:hypothetical protein
MDDIDKLACELKHIKSLLAMDRVKEYETNKEKILFLDKFGFDDSEIAGLVGTTPGSVAVEKSKAKKKNKKYEKKSKNVT